MTSHVSHMDQNDIYGADHLSCRSESRTFPSRLDEEALGPIDSIVREEGSLLTRH
jgi:hypothetical protein